MESPTTIRTPQRSVRAIALVAHDAAVYATRVMFLGRRACALVVVLALLSSVPLATPQRCSECAVDCPMHAHRAKGGKQLGCHHGAAPRATPDDDGPCLRRGACGHRQTAMPGGVPAVLPGPIDVATRITTEPVAIEPASPNDPPASAPLTGPPRRVAA